jgi:hypothetical protein
MWASKRKEFIAAYKRISRNGYLKGEHCRLGGSFALNAKSAQIIEYFTADEFARLIEQHETKALKAAE